MILSKMAEMEATQTKMRLELLAMIHTPAQNSDASAKEAGTFTRVALPTTSDGSDSFTPSSLTPASPPPALKRSMVDVALLDYYVLK